VLSDLSLLQWLLVGVAAVLIGLSKAGFGLGAGLVAVPLMVQVLGAEEGLGVMLLVLIVGDLTSLPHYPREWDGRNLRALIPGLVLGVCAGWLVLGFFDSLAHGELWLARSIGALCVLFVGLQVAREFMSRRAARDAPSWRPHRLLGVAAGTGAGLSSTLAHAGGPVIALYLLPQALGRRVFVGTVLRYFFAANLLKLVPYVAQDKVNLESLLMALCVAPLVLGGAFAGSRLNRLCSDRVFRWLIYVVALAAGLSLLLEKPDSPDADPGAESAERSGQLSGVSRQRQPLSPSLLQGAPRTRGKLEVAAQEGDHAEHKQQHPGIVQHPLNGVEHHAFLHLVGIGRGRQHVGQHSIRGKHA
jgi:hypothetical protein